MDRSIIAAYCVVRLADMMTPRKEDGTTRVSAITVIAIVFIVFALAQVFLGAVVVELAVNPGYYR